MRAAAAPRGLPCRPSRPTPVPRRQYHSTPSRARASSAASSGGKERIVVLGSGWAGFRLAKEISKKAYDVTVISPRNHFLFTPLLPETTVGTLEFRTIMEPVRAIPHLTFYQSAAKSIDTEKQVVTCYGAYSPLSAEQQQSFDIPFDRLLIAVGAHNQTFGIPGVGENAYFLKEVDQARRIRLKILECFEKASEPYTNSEDRRKLLTFIVVGGGATGIEFAAELSDFITEDIKRRYPLDVWLQARVILLEAGKTILTAFDQSLVGYATSQLRRRAVDIRFEVKVKAVHPQEIEMADGSKVPFGICVWSTGVAPRPIVRALPFDKSKDGRIQVDPFLRVINQKSVYALGDCAFVNEKPLPCTAQAADQQAKYLAKTLNLEAENKEIKPFVYVHRGMLAYVGSYKAISDLPHHKWRGLFAWLFWRSAYLSTLVSWSNRILVPMHWFKSFLFGRDVSYF